MIDPIMGQSLVWQFSCLKITYFQLQTRDAHGPIGRTLGPNRSIYRPRQPRTDLCMGKGSPNFCLGLRRIVLSS
jgi:hypothetical protein